MTATLNELLLERDGLVVQLEQLKSAPVPDLIQCSRTKARINAIDKQVEEHIYQPSAFSFLNGDGLPLTPEQLSSMVKRTLQHLRHETFTVSIGTLEPSFPADVPTAPAGLTEAEYKAWLLKNPPPDSSITFADIVNRELMEYPHKPHTLDDIPELIRQARSDHDAMIRRRGIHVVEDPLDADGSIRKH